MLESISVICPTVVLKFGITVFINPYIQILQLNLLDFSVRLKKTSFMPFNIFKLVAFLTVLTSQSTMVSDFSTQAIFAVS